MRWLGALVLAGLAGAVVIYRSELGAWILDRGATSHDHDHASVAYYTCSMDPSVEATEAGACPICGMALTPVAKEDRASDVVSVGLEARQRIGARIAVAEVQRLEQHVAAIGVVRGTATTCGDACDHVWVDADVYRGTSIEVPLGQPVHVLATEVPLTPFAGKVVSSTAGRLGIEINNPDHVLLPGMHADVQIDIEVSPRLAVPQEAVVYAGSRRIVFVDRGGGRFEPRSLTIGIQAAGFVEVLEGVRAGEHVLAAGTFLVAAESRIRAGTVWAEPVARSTPPQKTGP